MHIADIEKDQYSPDILRLLSFCDVIQNCRLFHDVPINSLALKLTAGLRALKWNNSPGVADTGTSPKIFLYIPLIGNPLLTKLLWIKYDVSAENPPTFSACMLLPTILVIGLPVDWPGHGSLVDKNPNNLRIV